MQHGGIAFPYYFVKQDLNGVRLKLKAGDPFPIQQKPVIRGLAKSYGVEDAELIPFDQLPYVDVVDVRSKQMAKRIQDEHLRAPAVKKLVKAGEVAHV